MIDRKAWLWRYLSGEFLDPTYKHLHRKYSKENVKVQNKRKKQGKYKKGKKKEKIK